MRLTSLIILFAVAGCVNKYSGFLDDDVYGKLKPGEKKGSMFWIKEGADLRAYDYLLIEPVACLPGKDSDLTEEQKKKASDAFHEILVKRVDPYYPVVTKPAQHVLRVRIALTELTPTGDMGVGAAALEVDFRDAQTNEVLCAGVSRIEGSERGKEAKREWQAVEGAFYEWADRLLEFMDSYHLEK